MSIKISVTVNGVKHTDRVEPRLLLVHYLRDTLRLTGTHVGCDTSSCGACTIHVNGKATKSCTMLAVQADGVRSLPLKAWHTMANCIRCRKDLKNVMDCNAVFAHRE